MTIEEAAIQAALCLCLCACKSACSLLSLGTIQAPAGCLPGTTWNAVASGDMEPHHIPALDGRCQQGVNPSQAGVEVILARSDSPIERWQSERTGLERGVQQGGC